MLTCTTAHTRNRTTGLICHGGLTCLLLLLLWYPGEALAQTDLAAAPLKQIRFAVLHDIYSEVTRRDARVALELIMQKTVARKSYPYDVTIDLMERSDDIVNAIQKGGYHFVTLSGIDYFSYRKALDLTPVLIPSKSDLPTDTLLLLVQKGQSLPALARKAQRKLIIENGRRGDLSRIWIDQILANHALPASERFFTQIRRVQKPARAVLPVFFNQADACVVTRNALDVIEELNPQIGLRIEPLFLSEGVVRLLICATSKPSPEDIDTFIRESVNIDHNADTRQAMMIIQMKRFLHVSTQGLEATRKLLSGPTR